MVLCLKAQPSLRSLNGHAEGGLIWLCKVALEQIKNSTSGSKNKIAAMEEYIGRFGHGSAKLVTEHSK